MKFEIFRLPLVGLEAGCLALPKNRNNREVERGCNCISWSQGKGFRDLGLFCNSYGAEGSHFWKWQERVELAVVDG